LLHAIVARIILLMIIAWKADAQGLSKVAEITTQPIPAETIWLDVVDPSPAEKTLVEEALGLELPSFTDMKEIETSSRLYHVGDVTYMTVVHLLNTNSESLSITAIAYILGPHQLITVRHQQSAVFKLFIERAGKSGISTPSSAFAAFMEMTTGLLADLLEGVNQDLERASMSIFCKRTSGIEASLQKVILQIGSCANLSSKVRESLLDKIRVLNFAENEAKTWQDTTVRPRLQVTLRDVQSLSDYVAFMEDKTSFLLDATVGMISIEQNRVIKIFSIVAVIFMPPTLIASIYGMNFKNLMYELDWKYGYPYALGLMLTSALITLWFFRRRKWM
jgi:magnesium transporter